MCGFCLVLKDRKGSLIGESDVITLYCQPFQRICDFFLSFNTNQKPRIKSPKSGDFENKIYIGRSPDPFSSRPNIKEEKAVWLRETTNITNCYVIVNLVYEANQLGHAVASYIFVTDRNLVHSTRENTHPWGSIYHCDL